MLRIIQLTRIQLQIEESNTKISQEIEFNYFNCNSMSYNRIRNCFPFFDKVIQNIKCIITFITY